MRPKAEGAAPPASGAAPAAAIRAEARGEIGHKRHVDTVERPVVARPEAQPEGRKQHRRRSLGIAEGAGEGREDLFRGRGFGAGRRPNGQPPAREATPVETRPGVDLAVWRHVGMADHPLGADPPAGHDAAEKRFERRHLRLGEGPVAGIGKLDPDRAGIDVVAPLPAADARVPGPRRLGHQRLGPAVLGHQPMRRDLGRRIAQPRPRRGAAVHAGVMDHDQLGARLAAPFTEIGRGQHGPIAAPPGTGADPSRRRSRHRPDRG
ncbi:hypothetical protein SDC9_30465 [bioreactor metagenome]|uniref:Uncharacterized protein n=1 Tax=bioreactor metagenome TaxID=1076179 RepID=A0A644UZK2_9ZZZZ